jgi:hypothetical protein
LKDQGNHSSVPTLDKHSIPVRTLSDFFRISQQPSFRDDFYTRYITLVRRIIAGKISAQYPVLKKELL